jgi:hypothetical protein
MAKAANFESHSDVTRTKNVTNETCTDAVLVINSAAPDASEYDPGPHNMQPPAPEIADGHTVRA